MTRCEGIVCDIIMIDLTSEDEYNEEIVRLADKAKTLLGNELTESSAQCYSLMWSKFETFCYRHNRSFLPATIDTIILYLTFVSEKVLWRQQSLLVPP